VAAAERLGKEAKKQDVTAADRTAAFLKKMKVVRDEFDPRKAGSAAIKLQIQSALIGHYEYDAWYWGVVVMASSLAFTASFVFAEVGTRFSPAVGVGVDISCVLLSAAGASAHSAFCRAWSRRIAFIGLEGRRPVPAKRSG
jgi:hypothetical protein